MNQLPSQLQGAIETASGQWSRQSSSGRRVSLLASGLPQVFSIQQLRSRLVHCLSKLLAMSEGYDKTIYSMDGCFMICPYIVLNCMTIRIYFNVVVPIPAERFLQHMHQGWYHHLPTAPRQRFSGLHRFELPQAFR